MGCRLPIQIRNRQYKFNESKQTSSSNRQLVAGCRFRFETVNISSTNRQLATCCRLPIQLPIRYRQVQRISNWQLVAGCRVRFETDNIQFASCWFVELILPVSNLNRQPADSLNLSVSNRQLNRQPAISCKLPIRWTYIVCFESESATLLVADSLKLSVSNRQLAIRCRFVELILSVSNPQPATEMATGNPLLTLCFESATGNQQPATNFMFWIGNRQPAANFTFP